MRSCTSAPTIKQEQMLANKPHKGGGFEAAACSAEGGAMAACWRAGGAGESRPSPD